MFQVVEIRRPVCCDKTPLNYLSAGVFPYELCVKNYTTINIGEALQVEEKTDDVVYELVDVVQAKGVICKC